MTCFEIRRFPARASGQWTGSPLPSGYSRSPGASYSK
jgi:hypothetical protein